MAGPRAGGWGRGDVGRGMGRASSAPPWRRVPVVPAVPVVPERRGGGGASPRSDTSPVALERKVFGGPCCDGGNLLRSDML